MHELISDNFRLAMNINAIIPVFQTPLALITHSLVIYETVQIRCATFTPYRFVVLIQTGDRRNHATYINC